MLGIKCDLKMYIRNLAYPSPTNRRPTATFFRRFRNLRATSIAYRAYLPKESVLTTTRGVVHRFKISRTLVHKRLAIVPVFYPPSVNSAFHFIARLHKWRPVNKTQPNFAKQWTVNRTNNLPYKSRGHPSPIIGGQNALFVRFFDDFET